MREREGRSEREGRVTVQVSYRVEEGGVELASVWAVATTASQTDHRRRHRPLTWPGSRRITWPGPVTWPGGDGGDDDEQRQDERDGHGWAMTSPVTWSSGKRRHVIDRVMTSQSRDGATRLCRHRYQSVSLGAHDVRSKQRPQPTVPLSSYLSHFCHHADNSIETVLYSRVQYIIFIKHNSVIIINVRSSHRFTYAIGWLGSVVVGRSMRDREVASSTPGRCTTG